MAIESIDGKSPLSVRDVILWPTTFCILAAGIGFSWNATPLAQVLAAILIACALVHASFFYGFRTTLAFFVICIAITFTMENIGTATGIPFGHYHFVVDVGLPRVGNIPVIVGPLWFGMGYFSWIVASTLLDGADQRLDRRSNLFGLPIVAAFVMTQWDVVMDPPASTMAKVWIWHEGGANFGVPLSNYVGWLLTSWLFFQSFAFYLRHRPVKLMGTPRQTRELRLIAILFYVSAGLTHIVPWLFEPPGEVIDAAGHAWRVHDLRETTVTIMLFTMFFSSVLAVLHLVKRAD
jgi:putative membrane protein